MTEWKQSYGGGWHRYRGPLFCAISPPLWKGDHIRASVYTTSNGRHLIMDRVPVSDYDEGKALCDKAVDDFIRDIDESGDE